MIEPPPPELATLLATERVATGPDAAIQAGVRARLARTIGSVPLGHAIAGASTKLVTLVVLGVVAVGTGVGLGAYGLATSTSTSRPPPPQIPSVAGGTVAVADRGRRPASPQLPAPTSPPVPSVAPPVPPARPPQRRRIDAPLPSPPPAAAPEMPEPTLLTQAWQALSAGDASHALAIVDEDAATRPHGALEEERRALEVAALDALGRHEEARADARVFLLQFPRSLHARRVGCRAPAQGLAMISRCALALFAVSACQLYDKSVGSAPSEPDAASSEMASDASPPPPPPLSPVLGSTRWAVILGNTTTFNDGVSIAIDPNDNVILGGNYDEPFPDNGGSGFVSKLAAGDGGVVWTRGWATGSAYVNVEGVATDGGGNVYAIGHFGAHSGSAAVTIDFGGQSLTANNGPFALKLASDGSLVWVRTAPNPTLAAFMSLAIGSGEEVYLVGEFGPGTITFPNGSFTNPGTTDPQGGPTTAAFIEALGSDGTLQWGGAFTSTTNDDVTVQSVSVAPDNDIVFTGAFSGAATFGGDPIVTTLPCDYLARFSSSGTLRYRSSIGAVELDGQPYVSENIVRPDDVTVTNASNQPLPSIGALDAVGSATWTTIAQGGFGWFGSIAAGVNGATIVGGTDQMPLQFETGSIGLGSFVAAFDASGRLVDATTYTTDSTGMDEFSSIEAVASSNGLVAFTTSVDQPVNFGTGTLAAGGMGSGSSSVWTTDIAVVMMNAP